ncbi:MAG: DNA alkylation repair protein [Myxococcales bacterium]|jgi:3-methyladenine DNA glycosylase AlkD|nr:DNA alkylation repair protein [Myxococcales bacterium]
MTRAELESQLKTLSDPTYQKFSASLIPGVRNLLGIRLPALRNLARALVKENGADAAADILTDTTFEELMLQGILIGQLDLDVPIEERLCRIATFVPKIDNWSVCDSFCCGLRWRAREADRVFDFLRPYLAHEHAFFVRFGVVMLLAHFIDEAHIGETLERLSAVAHESYYVKMAVAWAVSVCFVKYPDLTLPLLLDGALDDVTHKKAIQKIIESRRVDAASKARLRTLKRHS